ncbi:CDP-glucose 4,6-dehydratase [Mucilaginibacter mali]|uniref:CDP-glucose 4,6-dehydratase n=1 Tax=Mucilaginibacter mali TaxID=2740462 RepID=A0A7D4TP12_9SPHI|nr:CDP-glucose 4,6-dehydratase [Mucilaginibacter mali]QKJ31493.1 CDP-glucose 4,6-dehydratase [Mucilaginibacter mali]
MIQLLKSTYQGKKVFVTGHTGFKGSWLLKILSLLQANVKGYALAPQNEDDLFNLIDGNNICRSVIADIRDAKKLQKEVLNFQPDFVFHLAAQPLVRLSYHIPAETFEVNVIGTANVLDAVKLLDKECKTIIITTDKVYHNYEWVYPYRENDRLGGYDPYSSSKACAEILIDSYRNSFFNVNDLEKHKKTIAVGRAGNVIGGGDWSADRLMPDIARALGSNQKIVVRNPNSIRPWQHVLEPLVGYLLLGDKLTQTPREFSQAYNFGPYADDSLRVDTMVNLAIENWGSGEYENVKLTDQPHEAGLLKLDISKAIQQIGWKPRLNAATAVNYTISWYKHYYDQKTTINNFTENQILDFIASK